MHLIIKKILMFLLCYPIVVFSSIAPIVIQPNINVYKLENEKAEVFFDPTKKMTLSTLSSSQAILFKPFAETKNGHDYDKNTWIHFFITNSSNETKTLFLTGIRPNILANSHVYEKKGNNIFEEIRQPKQSYHLVLFVLKIGPNTTNEYYIEQYTSTFATHYSEFYLERPSSYIYDKIDVYFIMGISYGIPIALVILSIFLFFFLRENSYLVYSCFVIASSIGTFAISGLINHYTEHGFGQMPFFAFRISIVLSGFFFIFFAKLVLRTEEFAPKYHRLIKFTLWLFPLFLILSIVPFKNERALIINDLLLLSPAFYILASNVLGFITAIVVMRNGYAVARYYIAGMFFLFISYVIYLLGDLHILVSTFLVQQAPQIGLSIDMILQAIALSVKVNLLEESKIKTQLEIINQKDIRARLQQTILEEETQLVKAYARFFPSKFLTFLNKTKVTEINLGNKVAKNLNILFVDLENLYTLSSIQKNIVNFINEYVGRIGFIIRERNGFIDKFVGDSLIALFDNVNDALLAAQHIFQELKTEGLMIEMEMGVHQGPMMLGTIGEPKRMDGTVISDAVNIASRIQSLNKLYKTKIIVTEAIIKELTTKERFNFRFIDHLYLKGKTVDLKIFEMYNVYSPSISTSITQSLSLYNQAINCYFNLEFESALDLFLKCQKIVLHDRIIQIYIERCKKLIEFKKLPNRHLVTQFKERISFSLI